MPPDSPGERPKVKPNLYQYLDLAFLLSRTVRNECLFKFPSLWYNILLWQLEWANIGTPSSPSLALSSILGLQEEPWDALQP